MLDFLYHGKMSASLQEIHSLRGVAGLLQIAELEMLCKAVHDKALSHKTPIGNVSEETRMGNTKAKDRIEDDEQLKRQGDISKGIAEESSANVLLHNDATMPTLALIPTDTVTHEENSGAPNHFEEINIGGVSNQKESSGSSARTMALKSNCTEENIVNTKDNAPTNNADEIGRNAMDACIINETEHSYTDATDTCIINETEHSYSKTQRNTEYECTVCKIKFLYGHALFAHEQQHRNNVPVEKSKTKAKYNVCLICSVCGKVCTSKKSLAAHERSHRILPFKCNMCEARFHFQVNVDNHILQNHKPDPDEPRKVIKCKHCEKSYHTVSLLQQHQAKAHKVHRDPHLLTKCNFCDKMVTDLQQHTSSVHINLPLCHKCGVCGKSMKHQKSLNDHMNIHTKQKPYKCVRCKACFAHSGSLHSHKRHCSGLTTEEKAALIKNKSKAPSPNKVMACKVCGKLYSSVALYRAHVKLHGTTTRFLHCIHCGKIFNKRGAYRWAYRTIS